MKCPNCGQEINQKVCSGCGCTVIKDEELRKISPEENFAKQKVRPSGGNDYSYRQKRGGNSFFGGIGGGLFDSIFGNIFDMFGSYDEDNYEDEDYGYYDDFGNPMPIDVYGRDFVEIKEIELYDSDGNLLEKGEKKQSKVKKVLDKLKDKCSFKKDKDNDMNNKDSRS